MELKVELSERQAEAMFKYAVAYYVRENPRARWTPKERRRAIRFGIQHMAQREADKERDPLRWGKV